MNTKKLLLLVLTLLCVACLAFSACEQTPNSNAISGLADISITCGDNLPTIAPVAEYGTVTVTIAKAVDGTEKENLTYGALPTKAPEAGTYYLKATVEVGENYQAATAYAKLTVSHKAFNDIAGNGTLKEEATSDGKYKTWEEKECPCGAIIKGNEKVNDKKANVISGLSDVTLVCGSAIDVTGVTATFGTATIQIAAAVEGTEKENLTYAAISGTYNHGVYYIRATVAEGDNYQAATAYAKVTINHKAYADIEGEVLHQAVVDTTKGYDYKLCACEERIHGETEYVNVTIKADGTVIDTQELAIGAKVAYPATSKLPTRTGYAAMLLLNGNVWNAGETVSDFATIDVATRWVIKDDATIESVKTNWLFIANDDTGLTDETVNKLTQEDNLWKIETLYNSAKPASPAEVNLGDIALKVNYTYQFAITSTHRTRICFALDTWDTHNYLITEDMANKPIVVTVTYTGSNTVVTFNGEVRTYTNAQWPTHNLNCVTLAIQDKDAKDEADHPRYTVSISKQVSGIFDYIAIDARLVASLPEVADINVSNADEIMEAIETIEALRTAHFTAAELASATSLDAHKKAAQEWIDNHTANLKALENALPEFDSMFTADKDTQDAAYQALTKYLAYYNVVFTAEEKAKYEEPQKISFYREFFKGANKAVFEDAIGQMTGFTREGNVFVVNGNTQAAPQNLTATLNLPKVAYGAFDQVTFILIGSSEMAPVIFEFGGKTYTFTLPIPAKDEQPAVEGKTFMWVQFFIEKDPTDGKWYATANHLAQEVTAKVALSNDIVLGNESISVVVKTTHWSSVRIQGNGNDATKNQILGTLSTENVVPVHQVSYSYKTGAGDKTATQYYLNNGKLVLPKVSESYTDAEGKHTFKGWFADGEEYKADDAITASVNLVAKYEILEGDYTEYTVTYIVNDAEYTTTPEQTYHYNDNLKLPVDPAAPVYDGTGKHYEFKGWFVGTKKYTNADKVTEDLELEAIFELVDDIQYKVTLTNLDGADEDILVNSGTVAELTTPTRTGYVFEGWYKADGSKYDTTAEVTADITLAAKWLVPVTEKQTIISASDLSTQVTGTLNDGRTPAYDKADSWWTDSEGTKYDKWFLVGNNDPKEQDHNGIRTFVFPLINMSKYSQLNFIMLMNDAQVGSVSTPDSASETGWTDIGSGSGGNQFMQITISKVSGVWTLVCRRPNSNTSLSLALGEDVVNGTKPLEMRLWTNQTQWLYMSEIKAYVSSNVDYVAKAAEAATAIDKLAVDADNTAKFAALKTYLTWRSHFTATELVANPISTKATELQAALKAAGVRGTIWTPTADNLSDIGFQGTSDYTGISTMGKDWMKDKDSNVFQTAYTRNCQGVQDIVLTLPAINFATYSDVRFCLWVQNTAGKIQSLTINGTTAPMDKVGSTVYVVYIKTVNNVTSFEVCYNGSDVAVASGTIPATVANGHEALKLTISVDAWTQIQLSEFYGTL